MYRQLTLSVTRSFYERMSRVQFPTFAEAFCAYALLPRVLSAHLQYHTGFVVDYWIRGETGIYEYIKDVPWHITLSAAYIAHWQDDEMRWRDILQPVSDAKSGTQGRYGMMTVTTQMAPITHIITF